MGETKERKPLAAALLAGLLPGLGQIYNGQPAKGILFCLISIPLMSLTALTETLPACLLFLVFAAYAIGDAWVSAAKIKRVELKPCHKWYVYLVVNVGAIIVVTVIIALAALKIGTFPQTL